MTPQVSIIIPVFNGARFISDAIDSIFRQTFQDFEVIMIDDGSTDETREIVSRYRGLIYHYQENQGRPAARNTGLRHARGEYVAFLDADDIWNPDRLERGVNLLNAEPEIGLLHGEVTAIDAHGAQDESYTKWLRNFYVRERQKGSGYLRLLDRCAIFSSSVLFRRKCIDEVGFYDMSFPIYEDYDWYLRLASVHRISLMPGPAVAKYRLHDSNSFKLYTPENIARIYLRILEKQLLRVTSPELRSHVLKKMVDFHWRLKEKSEIRKKASEAIALNPKMIFNWRLFARLLFSL